MRKRIILTTMLLTMVASVGCSETPSNDATTASSAAATTASEKDTTTVSPAETCNYSYDEMVAMLEEYRESLYDKKQDLSGFPITKTFNYKNADEDYFSDEFSALSSTPDYIPTGIITSDISDFDNNGIPDLVYFEIVRDDETTDRKNYLLHVYVATIYNNSARDTIGFYAPCDALNGTIDACLHCNHEINIDYVTDGQKNYFSMIVSRSSITNDRLFCGYEVSAYDESDEYKLIPLISMNYSNKNKTLTNSIPKGDFTYSDELLYKDPASDAPGVASFTNYEEAVSSVFKSHNLDFDILSNQYGESSLIKHLATLKITAGGVKLENDTATATFECETDYYE